MSEGSSEAVTQVKYSSRIKLRYVVPAVFATVLLLVTSLLPLVIEHTAQSWLQDHGVESAKIENVDLNLFTGTVVLQGLQAGEGLNIKRLAVNIDWLPLFKQVIHIRSFELDGSSIVLSQDEQEQWQLAEIKLEPIAEEESSEVEEEPVSPWLVVVDDLAIEELLLNVNGKTLKLALPVDSLNLNLSGLLDSQQSLEAELKLGETDFTGFGYRLSNSGLHLAGKLLFALHVEDVVSTLKTVDAELKLDNLKLARSDGKKLAAADMIELSGMQMSGLQKHQMESLTVNKLSLSPALTQSGSLSLASISVQKLDADLNGQTSLAGLQCEGMKARAMVNTDDDMSLQSLNLQGLKREQNGEIKLASLQLKKLQAKAMTGEDDDMTLQGLKLQTLKMQPGKALNLKSFVMQGFKFMQQKGKQQLAVINRAELKGFSMIGADKGSFKQLSLDGVDLPASGETSLGSIGSIVASGAELDTQGLYHVKTLRFNDLDARLIKQKNGKIRVLDEITSGKKSVSKNTAVKAVVKKPAETVKTKDPVVVVDELLIGPGSKIAYRDESVFPPLDTRLTVKHFSFAPLDSSGKRDGMLDTVMVVGKNGELRAKGKLRPHARTLRADIDLTLKHIDMPGLSGYIESDFGKSIRTGQFNMDSSIDISNDTIDAKNKLLIRKLELGSSKQPGKAEQTIGMPVGMALDMLRNDRGDIEMEVPITGNLDDPNININAIINKALMSSLSTGAMTYAMLALQPYGSIVLAVDMASDLIKEAVKPKLTPVVFDELETTLDPKMEDYISKIAGLLNKSTQFRLQICGVATRIEGEPVARPSVASPDGGDIVEQSKGKSDEFLLQLGQSRSDAVMSALQKHGIATERLFTCRASIDETKVEAKPRVDLILD